MKINDKEIFKIKTHNSVLVEKKIKGLLIPGEVPVYHNFNYDNLIGIARLRWEKGRVFADIMLLVPVNGYPAIGYIEETKKVYCLSIGSIPNKDKDIQLI